MIAQISYRGYCALGGGSNPKLFTRAVYLGKHFMHMTYWLVLYT
jgi:hypothetical protein